MHLEFYIIRNEKHLCSPAYDCLTHMFQIVFYLDLHKATRKIYRDELKLRFAV